MFYMDKYGNERMRKTVPYKKRPYTSTYKKKKVKKDKKNKKKMDESTFEESFVRKRPWVSRQKKQNYPITFWQSYSQTPYNVINPQFKKTYRKKPQQNIRTGGLLGIEKKYLDVTRTVVNLTAPTDCSGGEINPSGGCTGCLSAPAQGDAYNERDGSKIVLKSILVQGIISCATSAGQTTLDYQPTVTIALVMDTQTNGATLNSEDVYGNLSNEAVQNMNILRNPSYTNRFKVLKHLTLVIPQPDSASYGGTVLQSGSVVPFSMSKKLDTKVTFKTGGNTADVANVIDNSLHIIAWTSNTSLTPQIGYNSRVRFVG